MSIWGDLPKPRWLAVIADRDHVTIEIVGFMDENLAHTFCQQFDSDCYEWAVITGSICSSGSVSDGRDLW